MAKAPNKVAFAERPVTIHLKRSSEPNLLPDGEQAWDVEAKVLSAGQFVPLSELPPYLSEAVREGNSPGLVALTPKQAENRMKFVTEGFSALENDEEEEEQETPDDSKET